MVKKNDIQFFMENMKMNRKRTEFFFDLLEQGFETQIFSNFPAHGMHRGRKGPFNYFSFWFFMARIKHWDIVR